MRQDQPEQALRLYSGPFMDGYFSSDGPDLDHWIEGERSRLARAYASALERCAQQRQAQGDWTGAVEHWRKLAAVDPYNARVARELMLALDAAGDRAGALQHARVHTVMLQEEFGAQPDDEIVKLAERLRAAPIAVRPARAASTQEPEDRVAARAASTPEPASGNGAAAESPAHAVVPHGAATELQAPSTKAPRVRPTAPARPAARRLSRLARRRPWLLALASVLITVAIARLIWILNPPFALPPREGEIGIAVRPFRAMMPSDSVEGFGSGMSEEISNALGRLEGLFVPSFTSSYLLRDKAAREFGERLGVRYVLEGMINRGGGELVVTASLVDARTEQQLWRSDRYAEIWDQATLTTIQNRIANDVVEKLAISLSQGSTPSPLIPQGPDSAAARAYFKARKFYLDRNYASLDSSLLYLQRAVHVDPNYALAWSGIADTYAILGAYDYGFLAPDTAYPAARAAADRARTLDPSLANPHATLGAIYHNYDWNWRAAKREFERAIKKNPGYAQAYQWYALFLATQDRPADARAFITRARELDPASPMVSTAFARIQYLNKEYDEAIRGYRAVIQEYPTYITAHAGIGLAFVARAQYDSALVHYNSMVSALGQHTPLLRGLIAHAAGQAGRRGEAREHLQKLKAIPPGVYFPREYLVLAHIGAGDKAAAIRELEEAYRARSGGVAYMGVEPAVDPLRAEPDFQALLRKLRLPR